MKPFSPMFARRLGLIVATFAIWLASMELPGPPQNRLEIWETILVDAHVQGRQFGPEIVFTYGPWAFLELGGYMPAALPAKLAWEIFGKLALAVTVILLSAALRGWRRWLFLAAWAATAAFFDNSAAVLITLLTLLWLLPAQAAWWQRALALGWLAWLAHFKFVFCLQAFAAMALVVVLHGAERRFRLAAGLLAAFGAAYVGGWLAAGQHLGNLPTFLRLSAEISSGYSSAMAVDAATPVLLVGLGVVLGCGGFLWLIWRAPLPPLQRAGAMLVVLANAFVAWKQGFTRADLHVYAFFLFCFLLGIALPGLFARDRRVVWQDATAALCVGGLALAAAWLVTFGPREAWTRWTQRPGQLAHLSTWRSEFDAALQREEAATADPALRGDVGRDSVDLFMHDQGLVLLNRLNYQPRPVIQSYSVYTPALVAANARYFQSARAPEFVVVRLGTIDNRYPGEDDAGALVELARRYDVARLAPDYAVLRKKKIPPPATDAARAPLAQHVPHFGDDMLIPDGNGHPVWMEIDFRPTLLGRLRAFLYHSVVPHLVITYEDAAQKKFRAVPPSNRDGLIVHPWLEHHSDFAALAAGRGFNWPKLIRLELARPSDRWFWGRPRVQFFALTDLPLTRAHPLDAFVEAGATNIRPLEIRCDPPAEQRSVGGRTVIFAHAPSEVVLPVPAGTHRLSGGCGLLEGAYTDGKTDGVVFAITALMSDGTRRPLWERALDPVAQAADRGLHHFSIELPAGIVRVYLRAEVGAAGNNNWDWTYWDDLKIVP